MGIINITPDSFSGDGLGSNIEMIVDQAQRFESEGADLLDMGAESTRPGHTPVNQSEEIERLLPAVSAVATKVNIPISIDTYKSEVARQCLNTGASIINDIWGGTADPEILSVAAQYQAPIVLMHNDPSPDYEDVVSAVISHLRICKRQAIKAGVPDTEIILDPGIGFAKTAEHNLEILSRLTELQGLESPVLIGTSRKSTIGRILDLPVEERIEGTSATVALSITYGADIIRVHDVKAMTRVSKMTDAIVRNWRPVNWAD
ncbi:MAG: dihydropteroate synthase [Dehalococcoidia bacterium]|nr:dihydropteroate synthase [Dehalococcoidia bacterium]